MSQPGFTRPNDNGVTQLYPTTLPPAQWNVPPGASAYSAAPNQQMWSIPNAQNFGLHPASQQWNNPVVSISPTTQPPQFHATFRKGNPRCGGIFLILVAILQIALGIAQFYTAYFLTLVSGVSFWGAVFMIIAGSLSLKAKSKASICLIKGSLGLNILVSIICILGLILNVLDFFYPYCYYGGYFYWCYDVNWGHAVIGGHAIRSIFIFTYILLFFVSVCLSKHGCRAINVHDQSLMPQVFVIQNPGAPPPSFPGSYPAYFPPQPEQHTLMKQGAPAYANQLQSF